MRAGLPALALGLSLMACATNAQEFSKSDWTVADLHCPRACAPDAESFIRSYLGKPARISASEFALPFLDRCDGTISYRPQRSTPAGVRAELDRIAGAPTGPDGFDSLRLPAGTVTGSTVYCTGKSATSPLARLLSVEEKRILLLFEGLVVVELR
jgi:hypothetical protein